METQLDPIANERYFAQAMVNMANKIFHRSYDNYKYMMAGMAALSFLIIDLSKNFMDPLPKISQWQSIMIFISISSCVSTIAYIYWQYYHSSLAISGQDLVTVNIEQADREELSNILGSINDLVQAELKCVEQRRCQIACAVSISFSLVTFGFLLLDGK